MRNKYLIFGLVAVAAALAGLYASNQQSRSSNSVVQAEVAPSERLFAMRLPDAAGQEQDLNQWRGRELVVNFWASWCAPCVEEMPELEALHADLQASDRQIIGIAIDSVDNVNQFAKKLEITYPLYAGDIAATDLSRALGNPSGGLPFTVWLRSDGSVAKTYLGRLDMAALRRDLGAPAAPSAP